MRREASPYAWSKPVQPPRTPARSSGDLYLSPESITPPAASNTVVPETKPPTSVPPSDWAGSKRRDQKCSTHDASLHRSGSEHVYEGSSTADVGRNIDSHGSHRASMRYSWTKPDQAPPLSVHSSPTTPFNAPTYLPDKQDKRPISSDGHSSSQMRKPAPSQVATLQQSERPPYPRQQSGANQCSRDSSPPLRSSVPDRSRDELPPSLPNSRPVSRGSSKQVSPQLSPRIQHPAEYPWGPQPAATNITRRTQPPSRLAASSVPPSPRPSSTLPTPTQYSPLPYPDDDQLFQTMPSESDHQYFPEQSSGGLPAYAGTAPRNTIPKRPPLSTRSSAAAEAQTSAGASKSQRSPSDYSSKPRQSMPGVLPVCSRRNYTTKYQDWYTLEGCPGFEICPHCLKEVFDCTSYRPLFKSSPPHTLNMPSRCEFSNPWIRLAWLLTVKHGHPTLGMFTSIFAVDQMEEPCPGIHKGVRNWYSIRDRDGHFLRGFTVCPSDVKKLGVLFPGFKDLLVPLPTRMSDNEDYDSLNKYCSLRPQHNNRFSTYIDCLAELHETGISAHRMPDSYDFVSLVRRKTKFSECTRDDKQKRAEWYYIPTLAPALTVCEECYNDVVVPQLRSNSDVAMRFNRSPQTVRAEDKYGLSCQLYSGRMREIFSWAVENNDMRYLARKAKDRKEVEDDFQQRCVNIKRDSERLKGRSGYAISSKAQQELGQLQAEIEAIGEVWEDWE